MGIISNTTNSLPASGPLPAGDVLVVDYLIESPLSTDIEDYHETDEDVQNGEENGKRLSNIYGTPSRRRPKFVAPKTPCVGKLAQLTANKRHWGARRMRRFENNVGSALNFDPEDICEDLSDMLPDTTTAFSQLFTEKDKMKVWNDFVHKSEEEQTKILRDCRVKKDADNDEVATCSRNAKDESSPSSTEKRFRQIDKSCRFILIHKPTVWDKLNDIEDSLSNFFKETPKGVFVHRSESGFERILIHAVSQYLLLKSISFNDEGGTRNTKVFNTHPDFTRPIVTLVSYLNDNFKQSEVALIEP